MEENVALDSKKQKKFVKSIRGIKKLIKKNEKIEAKSEPKKKNEETKPVKPFSMRLKDPKIRKKKRKERGLVYLSHIPHGFYEHQMTQYFKQFGVVTNARVIRSQRTGNSKGYAFVEFREPSVAQIVAETMNNYLMGKRLIKAAYIPPEKQKRRAFRKHWNSVHNPTGIRRLKLKKAFNADKDEVGNLKKASKLLSRLQKTKKKLSELGINYDFFTPVDVPEALLDKVIKKEKEEDIVEVKIETKSKKGKKEKVETKEDKVDKKTNKSIKNENKPIEVNKKGKQQADKNEVVPKVNKKDKKVTQKQQHPKVNEKQQKEKEQKLKDAGVKSVEEFISLDAEDSDDESVNFDSDEYEKMIGEDDEFSSSDGSADESGDNEEDSEGYEEDSEDGEESIQEEEVPAPKKGKGKPPPKVLPIQPKKQVQKLQAQMLQAQKPQALKPQTQKPQPKQQEFKPKNEAKRKFSQKPPVAAKKPKFEKQSQKPMKKQFKKK